VFLTLQFARSELLLEAAFAEDTPAGLQLLLPREQQLVSGGAVYMYFNYTLTSFRLIKTTADPAPHTAKFPNKQTQNCVIALAKGGAGRISGILVLGDRFASWERVSPLWRCNYCVFCVCAALN